MTKAGMLSLTIIKRHLLHDSGNGQCFFIPQKQGIIINIIADIHRGFRMVHTGAARAG